MSNPYFDPRKTPFSCRGAYLVLSRYGNSADGIPDLQLRTVSHQADQGVVCRIFLLVGGRPTAYSIEMEPAELRLVSDAGAVRICFGNPETVLFHATDPRLGLRFDFTQTEFIANFGYDIPHDGRTLRLFDCHCNLIHVLLDPGSGRMVSDQDWNGKGATHSTTDVFPDETGRLLVSLREIRTDWDHIVPEWDYDGTVSGQRAAFRDFLQRLPIAPEGLADARELAAYVLWSCCVRPAGALTHEAMLMSKNWMTQAWSWDHCFNSVALAGSHPDIAWTQFMLPFDDLAETGALPDSVCDRGPAYTFCKPPIHGWALSRMMERMSLSAEQTREAYEKLVRWTNWWLEFRDRDHNGLSEYDHGNDSGWDNSTPFLLPPPVELPDLQAFLVLQMETLADLARRLGLNAESEGWRNRAKAHLDRMCERCFDAEGRPLVRKAYTGETTTTDSLILYLPILLGKRLPEHIRAFLLRELRSDRFLTEWGFATESPKSDRYKPNGYWLGPIWAPVTLLLIDGLRASGEEAFADDIAHRFQRLYVKSGSAENFDALTGEGLCDPAYTWASAVFLTLLE